MLLYLLLLSAAAATFAPTRSPTIFPIPTVSVGDSIVCTIQLDGFVYCLGTNTFGNFGNGLASGTAEENPVKMLNSQGATAVVSGGFVSCVIISGAVKCTGSSANMGLLGNGNQTSTSLVLVANLVTSGAQELFMDLEGTTLCALKTNGELWCWGSNTYGQMGVGNTALRPTPVISLTAGVVVDAAISQRTMCIILATGVVKCAGTDRYGSLGNGTSQGTTAFSYVQVSNLLPGYTAITAGLDQLCVYGMGVMCWGGGNDGQLAGGVDANSNVPLPTAGDWDIQSTVGGYSATFAVTSNYTFLHSGGNNGNSYYGMTVTNTFNTFVPTFPNARRLFVGLYAYCYRDSQMQLFCRSATAGLGAKYTTTQAQVTGIPITSQPTRSPTLAGFTFAPTLLPTGSPTKLPTFLPTGSPTVPTAVPTFAPTLPPVPRISVGASAACALQPNRNVYCWGSNNYGNFGSGNTADSATPVFMLNSTGATAIVTGGLVACVVKENAVYCTGNSFGVGLLGNGALSGSTTTLIASGVTSGAMLVFTSLVGSTFCTLKIDGTVWCWGGNNYGQIGNGGAVNQASPVQTLVTGVAVDVAMVERTTCIMLVTGAVHCAGTNYLGSLGNGSTEGTTAFSYVQVSTLPLTYSNIVAGANHVCVFGVPRTWCWGSGASGSLANGFTTDSNVPVATVGDWTMGSVALGSTATFGVTTNFTTLFAGNNYALTSPSNIFTPVLQAQSVAAMYPGLNAYCFHDPIFQVFCRSNDASLGAPYTNTLAQVPGIPLSFTPTQSPTRSPSKSPTKAPTALPSRSPTHPGDTLQPTRLPTQSPTQAPTGFPTFQVVPSVSVGVSAACAIQPDGFVYCWGGNNFGNFGDGSTTSSEDAVQMFGSYGTTSMVASRHVTCVIIGGAVRCTGSSFNNGFLGDGSLTSSTQTLIASGVTSGAQSLYISAPGGSLCALKTNGELWCWGDNNNGQLGIGATGDQPSPVLSLTGGPVLDAAASVYTMCVILVSGVVKCAGTDSYGSLGNGTSPGTTAFSYVQVSTLPPGYTGITAGFGQFCVFGFGMPTKCWGNGLDGGLGSGGTSSTNLPATIVGDWNMQGMMGAGYVTFAVTTNHTTLLSGSGGDYGFGDSLVFTPVLEDRNVTNLYTSSTAYCFHDPEFRIFCRADSAIFGAKYQGVIAEVLNIPYTSQPTTSPTLPGDTRSPTTPTVPTTPAPTIPHTPVLSVSTSTACAIQPDGFVYCWGDNTFGQFGDGTSGNNVNATRMLNSFGATSMVTSGPITCVIISGAVFCTGGSLGAGLLGNGDLNSMSLVLIPSGVTTGAVNLYTNKGNAVNTCALKSNGQLWCWGENGSGQMGIGTVEASRAFPVLSLTGGPVLDVAISTNTMCVVMVSGIVKCAGTDLYGSLGNGTSPGAIAYSYVQVATLPLGYTKVASGYYQMCAYGNSKHAMCWGSNRFGSLATGTLTQSNPLPVATIGDWNMGGMVGGDNLLYAVTTNFTTLFAGSGTGMNFSTTDIFQPVLVDYAIRVFDARGKTYCFQDVLQRIFCRANEPFMGAKYSNTLAQVLDIPITASPTLMPTLRPSQSPTVSPTLQPTTRTPTNPGDTFSPTKLPTVHPTKLPTKSPTLRPTSLAPTTLQPTTLVPTTLPSRVPTRMPTRQPLPSRAPTKTPTSPPNPQGACNPKTVDGKTFCCYAGMVQEPLLTEPIGCNLTAEHISIPFGTFTAVYCLIFIGMSYNLYLLRTPRTGANALRDPYPKTTTVIIITNAFVGILRCSGVLATNQFSQFSVIMFAVANLTVLASLLYVDTFAIAPPTSVRVDKPPTRLRSRIWTGVEVLVVGGLLGGFTAGMLIPVYEYQVNPLVTFVTPTRISLWVWAGFTGLTLLAVAYFGGRWLASPMFTGTHVALGILVLVVAAVDIAGIMWITQTYMETVRILMLLAVIMFAFTPLLVAKVMVSGSAKPLLTAKPPPKPMLTAKPSVVMPRTTSVGKMSIGKPRGPLM